MYSGGPVQTVVGVEGCEYFVVGLGWRRGGRTRTRTRTRGGGGGGGKGMQHMVYCCGGGVLGVLVVLVVVVVVVVVVMVMGINGQLTVLSSVMLVICGGWAAI